MNNTSLFAILIGGLLVNNFVLSQFLGICPFLGVSKKLNSAVGMSLAVIFVMLMATAATWPIYNLLLVPRDLGYLQTIVFILIIAALVQLVEIALKRFLPPLYNSLGIYLPLITTNCAVLGVTILNIDKGYDFGQSLVNALPAGHGDVRRGAGAAGKRRDSRRAQGPAHHAGSRLPGVDVLPGVPGAIRPVKQKGACNHESNRIGGSYCRGFGPGRRADSGGGQRGHGGPPG